VAVTVAAFTLHGPARVGAIVALAVLQVVLFGCGMSFIRMQYFIRSICRGNPGRMKVALTFDDGPDGVATPALLDLLQQEKVPATFFCIGQRVVAYPELAARIVADGHLIGNHSHHHSWLMTFNRARGLMREFKMAQDAIRQTTGVTPRFLRPPMGLTNPHFPWAIRQLNLTLIGWDVRPLDTVRSAKDVIESVLAKTTDGSIIVLHDGGSTPDKITHIASTLIRELRARGFEFERVDRLI